jgi:hypothetical protein
MLSSDRPRALSALLAAALALLATASATVGCGAVPAYDRGRLAHPTMTTSDLDHPSEEHVRAVQEGATGGGFSAGGGCGCN